MARTREHHAAVATMPTPVVSTSTSRAPRLQRVTRASPSAQNLSPATSGSISAAVAATIRMRTVRILFLVGLVGEPANQVADVGVRRAVFDRGDVLDHVAMRRRPERHRAVGEVVLLGEELDLRRGAVDRDAVADAQAVVRFGGSRLSEITGDFREID